MARTYTHKMYWESEHSQYDIKIHKDDTIEQFIEEFKDLYNLCHTVWYQAYPLKDNPKIYLKARTEED